MRQPPDPVDTPAPDDASSPTPGLPADHLKDRPDSPASLIEPIRSPEDAAAAAQRRELESGEESAT